MYLMGQDEIDAASRVMQSRDFFRFKGPEKKGECDHFEEEFALKLNTKNTLLLTSGTNALVAALHGVGVGPGHKVIIPAYTFFATAAAVIQVGAVPVLANVDEGLGLCPKDVERLIDSEVAAVICVHMDGIPADLDPLQKICQTFQIPLIEDCAQAVGGSYRGRRLGTWGQVGCFSFNVDKIISCGEGGAICCDDESLFQKLFCLHDTCAQFGPSRKDWFESPFIGGSMRVSEISGAIMRVQLKKLDEILGKLRTRKGWLLQELGDVPVLRSHCEEGDCGTILHLKLNDAKMAIDFWKELSKRNIESYHISMRYAHAFWQWSHLLDKQKILNSQPNPFDKIIKKPTYNKAFYLPTIELLNRLVYLPIHIEWSRSQVAEVGSAIRDSFALALQQSRS